MILKSSINSEVIQTKNALKIILKSPLFIIKLSKYSNLTKKFIIIDSEYIENGNDRQPFQSQLPKLYKLNLKNLAIRQRQVTP